MIWHAIYAAADYPAGTSVLRVRDGLEHVLLSGGGYIREWNAPVFAADPGALLDYPPNDLGWRLCSPSMKEAIDGALVGLSSPGLQWLDAQISLGQSRMPYFIMHFAEFPGEVLDEQKTVYTPRGSFVRPTFRSSCLAGKGVFGSPASHSFYAATKVAMAIQGMSGFSIERARVTVES